MGSPSFLGGVEVHPAKNKANANNVAEKSGFSTIDHNPVSHRHRFKYGRKAIETGLLLANQGAYTQHIKTIEGRTTCAFFLIVTNLGFSGITGHDRRRTWFQRMYKMEANNPKTISVSIEYPKTMRDTKPAITKRAMKSMIGLTIDISASNDFYWWAMLGLNQRPLPVKTVLYR